METNEQEMRTLKNKMEASLEFMKQEHNIAAAKVYRNSICINKKDGPVYKCNNIQVQMRISFFIHK